MPLSTIKNLADATSHVFNPSAGSASGSHAYIVAPFRGWVTEAGGAFQTSVATGNVTMGVNIVKWTSSTSSTLTEIISSANATFNSVMLITGNVFSASPASPAYVEAGDVIRITTSGGNAVTTGATTYVSFRKG